MGSFLVKQPHEAVLKDCLFQLLSFQINISVRKHVQLFQDQENCYIENLKTDFYRLKTFHLLDMQLL